MLYGIWNRLYFSRELSETRTMIRGRLFEVLIFDHQYVQARIRASYVRNPPSESDKFRAFIHASGDTRDLRSETAFSGDNSRFIMRAGSRQRFLLSYEFHASMILEPLQAVNLLSLMLVRPRGSRVYGTSDSPGRGTCRQ